MRSREEAADEVLRALALEDPVRAGREDEEDPDEDLERGEADVCALVEEVLDAGEALEAALDSAEDLLADAGRLPGFLS